MGEFLRGIAVAICSTDGIAPRLIAPPNHRYWSRQAVLEYLVTELPANTLVGMDLGISLPFSDAGAFFPGWAQSPPDARSLWNLIDEMCTHDPHLSATSFIDHPEISAYFRRHAGREGAHFHLPTALHRKGRFRLTETAQEHAGCKPYSNFNLVGAAQVGKSSLTGMRMLHHMQSRLFVWPVDGLTIPQTGSVIVEIYTALAAIAAARRVGRSKIRNGHELYEALAQLGSKPANIIGPVDDHRCDALITAAWLRLNAHRQELWNPQNLDENIAKTEGWTFGAT